MKRSTIASLAILKVNFEVQGRDYIDNFVPLVAESLRLSPDDVVSLPALQASLRENFGLALPLNPLRQVLQRAAKARFVHRSAGVFYRDLAACSQSPFAAASSAVSATVTRVVSALRVHAKERHSIEWTDEQTEDALLSFVGDSGLDVLFATAERSVLPQPKGQKGAALVVATFLTNCQGEKPELLRDFETLVKGALLANALYLPDHSKITERFRNTRVYFDTTFLIFALGYAGPGRQAPCAELIGLLKEYGAELRCFQHTVDEIRGILDACAAKIRRDQLRDAFGPTIEYFITQGLSSTDIDLLAARVPQRLAVNNIQIEDKPPYEREFVIDEASFEKHLHANVGYHNPKALQHDVDCASAIARVRRGRDSFSVETCRALFVTTNNELARATRVFFQHDSPPGAVALCISDYALGNLLWLKNPIGAPDLPRRRLIADAYAAMEPPEALWKTYLVEITRLEERGEVSADDYVLLRHSMSAKVALMEITKGEPSAFTQGTVAEILEVAKRNVRADLQEELSRERSQRIATEASLAVRDAEATARENRIRTISEKVGRYVANTLFGLVMVGLGIATLYTFPWQLPAPSGAWPRYLMAAAQAVLFLYAVASMGWGTTIRELSLRFQERLAHAVQRRLRSLISPDWR